MAAYFFDSSAIVKRYVNEPGSQFVDGLVDSASGNLVLVARITHVEVIGALSRRSKGGSINPIDAQAGISAFKQDIVGQYLSVEVTAVVVEKAMGFAELYGLRGYDAVQLAAAIEANEELVNSGLSPLVLVSADTDLNNAAVSEGLSFEDPNDH